MAPPFHLFFYQLQCFCPFTENFISITTFFIFKISKTFLLMGAISLYFSLRILIIHVPNSVCSINSASLDVNFSISWGWYLSFTAVFKCQLGIIGCALNFSFEFSAFPPMFFQFTAPCLGCSEHPVPPGMTSYHTASPQLAGGDCGEVGGARKVREEGRGPAQEEGHTQIQPLFLPLRLNKSFNEGHCL